MNHHQWLENLADPALFERMCKLLLQRQYRDYQNNDDSSGDDGADGFDPALETIYAIWCPKRLEKYDEKARSKIRGDLSKVPRFLARFDERFTKWVFVCSRELTNTRIAYLKKKAKAQGLLGSVMGQNAVVGLLLRCPEVEQQFYPFASTPDRSEKASTDHEILDLMAECFERPAFTTPFRDESSLPAFKKAISDTIEALNTGVRRLRDGTEIGRIPPRSQLRDPHKRKGVAEVVNGLVKLRTAFDRLLRSGDIRPCGCNVPDCPIYSLSWSAERELGQLRAEVLTTFARVAEQKA